MDYNLFLKRCEEKFPKEECLGMIVDVFKKVFEDENYCNDSKVRELFYAHGKMSKPQFYRIKKYVKELYQWFFEQGAVTQSQIDFVKSVTIDDVVSQEEMSLYYFPNLDGALDFVTSVGAMNGLGDRNDMLMMKSIVVLSWYGVDVQQILSIRKSDLSYTTQTLFVDGDKAIKMEASHFDILYRFAMIDSHRGFPTGNMLVFQDSPYLMRTARSIQMNSNTVYQAIKRFNVVASAMSGRKIGISALQTNGVFCKMLTGGQESKDLTNTVQSATGCDRHEAFWYKAKYEKWKGVYYGAGGDIG